MSDKPGGAVVVVGAGRVGLYLARVLAGIRPVTGIVVRSGAGRERAAAAGFEALSVDDPRLGQASTLLLCVPDDVLPDLVRSLADGAAAGQFVAHTSGRHGVGVLHGL